MTKYQVCSMPEIPLVPLGEFRLVPLDCVIDIYDVEDATALVAHLIKIGKSGEMLVTEEDSYTVYKLELIVLSPESYSAGWTRLD